MCEAGGRVQMGAGEGARGYVKTMRVRVRDLVKRRSHEVGREQVDKDLG